MLNASGWASLFLLAEAGDNNGGSPLGTVALPLVAIAVLFYFMIFRTERKKQQSHRAALESLKKNDRVVTIGGIYGVVTNVQRETDEVTIKVDEATNTKLRLTLGSIARIMADESATTDKATKSSS